ncbi:MAG: ATP cone domain-containing protein, partial [Nanoarchaeota archaeon]
SGILKACEKRPVSLDVIDKSIDRIEVTLKGLNSSEVESRIIGNLVMKELKKLDKVAYIRFASVYKEFDDPQSFEKEVKILLKK